MTWPTKYEISGDASCDAKVTSRYSNDPDLRCSKPAAYSFGPVDLCHAHSENFIFFANHAIEDLLEHRLAEARDQWVRNAHKESVVYFCALKPGKPADDWRQGLVKIGFTTRLEDRMGQLGCVPLAVIPEAGRAVERELHREYEHLRVRDEWFENRGKVAKKIEDLQSKGAGLPMYIAGAW